MKTSDFLENILKYIELSLFTQSEKGKIELIIIATSFTPVNIRDANNLARDKVILIKYRWLDLFNHEIINKIKYPAISDKDKYFDYVIGFEYLNKDYKENEAWISDSNVKNIAKIKKLQENKNRVEKEKIILQEQINKDYKELINNKNYINNWWDSLSHNLKSKISNNIYRKLNTKYICINKSTLIRDLVTLIFDAIGIYKQIKYKFISIPNIDSLFELNEYYAIEMFNDIEIGIEEILDFIKENDEVEYNNLVKKYIVKINSNDIIERIKHVTKLTIFEEDNIDLKPLKFLTFIEIDELSNNLVKTINETYITHLNIFNVKQKDLVLLGKLKKLEKIKFKFSTKVKNDIKLRSLFRKFDNLINYNISIQTTNEKENSFYVILTEK